ncbi:hypothetical protein [Streptomyces sp. SAJ15]|uniref:hypothetical protein n=1 Tax=Streptomyces sp. SAJ15 TaxID=2011095 RepID=UPI001642589D
MARRVRAMVVAAGVVAALLGGTTPSGAAPGGTVTVTVREAIAALPVAEEDRTGYQRDAFRHWVDDDADQDSARSLDIDHMVPLAEAWDSKWAELGRTHHSARTADSLGELVDAVVTRSGDVAGFLT